MFQFENTRQVRSAGNIKKTVLSAALAAVMGFTAIGAQAATPNNGDQLTITAGANTGTANAPVITGSYFAMDTNGDSKIQQTEKVLLSQGTTGLIIGTTTSAGASHGGAPTSGDTNAIDAPWFFANNTGSDYTTIGITGSTTAGLNMSGWTVTWNSIAAIPLGTGAWNPAGGAGATGTFTNGVGNFTWDGVYGDAYTLNFHATVPLNDPSNFGGVQYELHLEGSVNSPGAVPVVNPDSAKTIVGNPVTVSVLANDSSATGFTPASVTITTPPANGTAIGNANNTATYTPNTAGTPFQGADAFDYTVANTAGTSNAATVSVDVQVNVAPVAVNDSAQTNNAALDNAGGSLVINVLANDTDANNNPGLPGGINPVSVTVLSQPAGGSCVANANGTITYSQTPPSASGQFSCTYEVSDSDTFNPPGLPSNIATVTVDVTGIASDWPPALDPDIIPVLFFEAGVPGDPTNSSVPAKSGSFFTMQVTPTTLIYTTMTPGPSDGVVIGHAQPATGSHTGAATGNEQTGIDAPWSFFSNTGFHLTRNNGVTGNPDGTLEFNTKWFVGWNGIAAINLGGSSDFPQDLGFALITCTPAPCADQSTFELNYAAHVQDLPGEPSGFNGVPYTLSLNGVVGFLDGNLKTSNGTLTSQDRLTVDQVTPDTQVAQQCVGDCFDYTISNVTTPSVSVVIPLAGGVPNKPVWRVFNTDWASFDTSQGDTILSAPLTPGQTQCPDPGDPAYVPLTTGHLCLQLTIKDNGPNDTNPAVGTIADPAGMGGGGDAGGGVVFVDNRTTSSGGCTLANNSNPLNRGDWWLLAGFIAWLGWRRRNRTCR